MIPRITLGCGTGRCGSVSLVGLLGSQYNFGAVHEGYALPWKPDKVQMYRNIHRIIDRVELEAPGCTRVSHVGWFWINYISEFLCNFKQSRVICLRRNREEVVESFTSYDSPFYSPYQQEEFPDRLGMPPEEAVGKYWDTYNDMANWFQERFSDAFMYIDFKEALNSEDGQRRVLDFIDIPREFQVLRLGKVYNTRDKIQRILGVTSPQRKSEGDRQ